MAALPTCRVVFISGRSRDTVAPVVEERLESAEGDRAKEEGGDSSDVRQSGVRIPVSVSLRK
jgi:hypothetical protein